MNDPNKATFIPLYMGQTTTYGKWLISVFCCLILLMPTIGGAENSIITTAEGIAALGNDKTRNQTMSEARALAKRNAAEKAATHIQTASEVENFALQKDMVKAYAEAMVTIIEELEQNWLDDPRLGESFRIVIKAEVTPRLEAIPAGSDRQQAWTNDPTAPLTVRLTSSRPEYRAGQPVTLFLQGNKPFFARVVYADCQGNLIQILPNPYRNETYFQGGVTYCLPSGKDQYALTVVPPFGEETVTVYAATRPLGQVKHQVRGAVYLLENDRTAVAAGTRGIQLQPRQESQPVADSSDTVEFYETSLTIRTGP